MSFRTCLFRQLPTKAFHTTSTASFASGGGSSGGGGGASRGARTIVRDPRKNIMAKKKNNNKNKAVTSSLIQTEQQQDNSHVTQQYSQVQRSTPSPPFAPSLENQQSIGSSMVSYALAGAGMTLGFVLVGAIFGL